MAPRTALRLKGIIFRTTFYYLLTSYILLLPLIWTKSARRRYNPLNNRQNSTRSNVKMATTIGELRLVRYDAGSIKEETVNSEHGCQCNHESSVQRFFFDIDGLRLRVERKYIKVQYLVICEFLSQYSGCFKIIGQTVCQVFPSIFFWFLNALIATHILIFKKCL